MLEDRFPHPLPLPYAFPFPRHPPSTPWGELYPSVNPPLPHPQTLRAAPTSPEPRVMLPRGFLAQAGGWSQRSTAIPCQILPVVLPSSLSPANTFVTSAPRRCFRRGSLLTRGALTRRVSMTKERAREKKPVVRKEGAARGLLRPSSNREQGHSPSEKPQCWGGNAGVL